MRKEHTIMQNCTTILGIIDMRQRGISYDDCRSRYKVGCSTITLIMNRFKESGKDLDTLKCRQRKWNIYSFHPKTSAEKMIPLCLITKPSMSG